MKPMHFDPIEVGVFDLWVTHNSERHGKNSICHECKIEVDRLAKGVSKSQPRNEFLKGATAPTKYRVGPKSPAATSQILNNKKFP